MSIFPVVLDKLVEKFASLPGVGTKSAQRMAFFVLSLSDSEAADFASTIIEAKRGVKKCTVCQNLTDTEVCRICSGDRRNRSVICVVADPKDVIAMERSKEYNGLYHVLHGVISPINRVGPDDIAVRELISRLGGGEVSEVIMATNPDTEGEATAMYISRLIKPLGIKVTRIAYGIPVGSNLEFTDDATIFKALEGRREM
ncbi:MAG: recombination protein RecR [Clostridiales bacterium]|mgnify:FL=1|nr:recombination protein RecR [Clostridiales bacterium]